MNYLKKTFSVAVGSDRYRDNFDAVFGRARVTPQEVAEPPSPRQPAGAAPADTAETLLTEALTYVRQAVRVPGGPAEELAGRIAAFLEGRNA